MISGTEIGDTVGGRYRIERVLGQGGMGRVVLARHLITQRHVALKFLLDELAHVPEAAGRFLNEARAAVQIESEHVARVLDVDVLPSGAPYMVIEYLDGRDLSVVLYEAGHLPIQRAVDYVLEACVAVAEAHALGIVHRDLKPGNLFLAKRKDGSTVVKVLDFGIAKALAVTDRALDAARTRTGGVLGSPPYMSPEQLVAPATVDVRTDIWALGVVLYELITGLRPFRAEPLSLQLIEIVQQPQVPLDRMITGIEPHLVAAVERCLRKQREERFPDVAAFATALSFAASPTGKAAASKVRSLLATAARPELASAGAHLFAEHPTMDDREEPTTVVQKGATEAEPATTRPKPDLYALRSTSLVDDSATIALASRGSTAQPRPNALRTAAIVGGLVAATALGLGARALLKEPPTHAADPPAESAARAVAGSASADVVPAAAATSAETVAPPTPSITPATPPKAVPATSAADTKKKPVSREKPTTGTWGAQH